MDDKFDGVVLILFGYNTEFQQLITNWLIPCMLFSMFSIQVNKKFEKADVRKAPSGALLIIEVTTGLCTNIIGDNLKHETEHYLSSLGTLTMTVAVSNLLGLLEPQPPTPNSSFNVTLVLMMFLTIQYNGIKKGGLGVCLRELTEPMWLLTSLNVIGELVFPISLSTRLFGNILASPIATLLVYIVMRSFLPFEVLGYIVTPFLHAYFDVFSGLIQTYIFLTLASFLLSKQVTPEE